jgi:trk system potassium uptake protein TrkA
VENFIVIGLGRFGTAVARELCELGKQVLAMDLDRDLVQDVADKVTHAVVGDARDPDVLQSLGIKEYDCAIVAIGSDVGSSALVAMRLKEAGVPKVVCKARSHVHRRLLEKIGADRVVFPEHEMGIKVAQGLAHSNIINFIELSPEYGIVEVDLPNGWAGRTIRDLDIRAKFEVNVIAIRRGDDINVSPGADCVLVQGDRLLVLGEDGNISALCRK